MNNLLTDVSRDVKDRCEKVFQIALRGGHGRKFPPGSAGAGVRCRRFEVTSHQLGQGIEIFLGQALLL